ncbi:MAG: 4-hydroxythreonine-4-phosphate dehydrogenase PdxA [Spirochaetota bacterium]
MNKKPVLITEGDPAGISTEILENSISELRELANDRPVIFITARKAYSPTGFTTLGAASLKLKTPDKGLYVVCTHELSYEEDKRIHVGNPSIESAKAAFLSLQAAVDIQQATQANLVTMPLSKEWIIRAGVKKFTGHTEYLADHYKKDTFMLMLGKKLRVIPLTTHVPFRHVPVYLSKVKIQSMIAAILGSDLIPEGRIAFCGLNPHAGESGQIGEEELEIITPYMQEMTKRGMDVEGPLSADSVFTEELRDDYKLILTCYHDQGLIPFKALEGKNGINLTLGLDFIRVSPDHGTAFPIAGKAIADTTSFTECLKYV